MKILIKPLISGLVVGSTLYLLTNSWLLALVVAILLFEITLDRMRY